MLAPLGPAGGPEEEVSEGNVRDRYIVGLLAPSQKQLRPEEQDELALEEGGNTEDGNSDPSVLTTVTLSPSSMGLSFCVDGRASELRVTATWGRYRRAL